MHIYMRIYMHVHALITMTSVSLVLHINILSYCCCVDCLYVCIQDSNIEQNAMNVCGFKFTHQLARNLRPYVHLYEGTHA